jgi:hypothetical protein
VLIDGRPALRVDDTGIHAVCCNANMWRADQGSATVFINGKPAVRKGDRTQHCGGTGMLVDGSDDVIIDASTSGGSGATGNSSANGAAESSSSTSNGYEIRFRVISKEDRSPVAGVHYQVIGPDGSVVATGTTDAIGVIKMPVKNKAQYKVKIYQ